MDEAHKGTIHHSTFEEETRRLKVENQYMRCILDILHKNITLRDAEPQMEPKPPDVLMNDQPLVDLTTNVWKVTHKLYNLEMELDYTYRRISQLSTMIVGGEGSEVTPSPERNNTFTATGRKPRSNLAQTTEQSKQSLKLEKDLELITSAWKDMKEKERKVKVLEEERSMEIPRSSGSNEHQNAGHSSNQNDVQQGDEIQTNSTSKGHNVQQQTNPQPDHSQEQNLSDTTDEREKKTTSKGNISQEQKNPQPALRQEQDLSLTIIAMTDDQERKMKLITELDTMRRRIAKLEEENKRLNTLEEEKKKLQDELSDKEVIIIRLRDKPDRRPERPRSAYPIDRVKEHSREEMQMKIDEQRSLIDRLTTLKEQDKEKCERYCNEVDALKGQLKHCEHLLKSVKEESLKNERTIIGLREEKDQLLNRLSKIASDRLTHENTDISDLSDETRPSKLAEKMSELYDNQWTSAFDELKTNAVVDENAICILLKIMMETNQVCKEMTRSHYQKLKEACTCFEYSSSADVENKEKGKIITMDNISIEMQQDIKSIWRESSKKVLKKVILIIRDKVAERFEFPLLQMREIQLYLKECVNLCWMMNLQEKPMHLDISVPEKDGRPYFDTEKFRSYTKTGQHVAFVVWPALYLFDGGSLLKKGIAQGLKVEKGTSGQEHSSIPRS